MKKALILSLAFSFLSFPLAAADTEGEDIHIPMKYLEIDKDCNNTDVNLYNICLKEAFLNIISQNFTPEQQKDLRAQLDNIEAQVAEAEPDFNNPQNADLKDNPVKIKEFNAQNMNLIWKRLLVETINGLEQAQNQ